MGLFDGLRGKQEEYPTLDPGSKAASRLTDHQADLEDLAKRAKDRLEVVPSDRGLFVYVGKPPKKFGVVWYEDGEEHSFMSVMKKHGLTPLQIQEISDKLRDIYSAHKDQPRFSYPLKQQEVVVTPDETLAKVVLERIMYKYDHKTVPSAKGVDVCVCEAVSAQLQYSTDQNYITITLSLA